MLLIKSCNINDLFEKLSNLDLLDFIESQDLFDLKSI